LAQPGGEVGFGSRRHLPVEYPQVSTHAQSHEMYGVEARMILAGSFDDREQGRMPNLCIAVPHGLDGNNTFDDGVSSGLKITELRDRLGPDFAESGEPPEPVGHQLLRLDETKPWPCEILTQQHHCLEVVTMSKRSVDPGADIFPHVAPKVFRIGHRVQSAKCHGSHIARDNVSMTS
jgi:hypothetical protein